MLRHPLAPLFDRVFLSMLVLCSFGTVCALTLAPRQADANVAVIFAPWIDARSAISRATAAGAMLVRSGAYPFIVIVRSGASDFTARARREGALVILDANAIAGCGRRRAAS